MEKELEVIHKGERKPVNTGSSKKVTFDVSGGFNYYFDTMNLKFDNNKYYNKTLSITLHDANGNSQTIPVLLEGGAMSWINTGEVSNPNFGSITFSSTSELIFEFSFT
ncbi:MAG: hypothetical protein ACYDCN_15600 [Bacteroidia bacterium]